MKKITYILIILLAGFLFSTCEKDENGRIPDDIKDANTAVLIINDEETDPFINLSNPADFKISGTVDLLFKGEVKKIDIVVVYNEDYKNQYVVKSFTTVPSAFNISGGEIADAITVLSSASDIEEGDIFNLFTSVELLDGTYLPGFTEFGSNAITSSVISAMENLKDAVSNFVINVPCEFVLDNFLGNVSISENWGGDIEETTGEITLDPDYTGPYVGLIINMDFFWYDEDWIIEDGKLKIELSTYNYSIKGNPAKQILGPDAPPYTNPYYTNITGSINTCTGVMTVIVGRLCVDQGCFGGMPIIYTIKKLDDGNGDGGDGGDGGKKSIIISKGLF